MAKFMSDKDSLLSEVGQRIRAIRREQGLNLNQLALLTGISAPALSLIETGKRDPRLTTLARIAEALRVPCAMLIEDQASEMRGEDPAPSEGYDLGDYL